jgi:hypothetical protein
VIEDSDIAVSDAEFRDRVLKSFRTGDFMDDERVRFPNLIDLKMPGNILAKPDDLLKVVIISPQPLTAPHSVPGTFAFPDRVDQMAREIRDIIPWATPIKKDYFALTDRDPKRQGRHGKLVVQYDPSQRPGKSIVRIWIQGERVDGDITWDNLPHQRPSRRARRQEEEVCRAPQESTSLVTVVVPKPTEESPPPAPEVEGMPMPTEPNVSKPL